MILCITPNPAIDHTLTVAEFRPGEIMRATQTRLTAGGKGVNVARAIGALQGDAICLGFLGGYSGELMARLADSEGLSCEWTWIGGDTRTCVIVVNAHSGEATVINEPGPTVTDADWTRLIASALRSAAAKIISVSGSLPCDSGLDQWKETLTSLRARNQSLWVDTSGEALSCAVQLGLNIKVNSTEAAGVLGYPVLDLGSAGQAADELRRRGASTVVLTLGKQGALLADSLGTTHVPAPSGRTINSVGSGDCFLAGLLVALSNGHSTIEALRWAVAAGAANAMCASGAHFTYQEFQRMLSITRQL